VSNGQEAGEVEGKGKKKKKIQSIRENGRLRRVEKRRMRKVEAEKHSRTEGRRRKLKKEKKREHT